MELVTVNLINIYKHMYEHLIYMELVTVNSGKRAFSIKSKSIQGLNLTLKTISSTEI